MKFITVLLCVALVQIVSSTIISLEEGDAETKRIFKWIVDPVSPSFPVPRFRVQNGQDAEWKEFRFLATLNCSALPEGDVGMAIYDPVIDDWNCTSTGMLPNDTTTPSDTVTGIPVNCTNDYVAVWNATAREWVCNTRLSLLFQSEGLIQDLCRSEDLLVINYEESPIYINRPAGLCVDSTTRQVGPDAVVSLKRGSRNVGDPDEAFYVQTTSKAIGNLGATGGAEHFNWQYWLWSPLRTSFAASIGSFPPLLAYSNMHLAAVISSTYTFAANTYTVANIPVQFRVVRMTTSATGNFNTYSYMQYVATDWSETITAPSIKTFDGVATTLPNTALVAGNALSIRITTLPSTSTNSGSPKSAWFTVSLWVSQIVAEA